MEERQLSFWRWFFAWKGQKSGFLIYADRWLLVHLAVGVLLAWLVPSSLEDASRTSLLPLAAIFIGLSFAWGGNALALLQTEEIEALAQKYGGGLPQYVYAYLSAILVILVSLLLWGLAGLGFFDQLWPTHSHPRQYFVVELILYGLISLTLRECWSVVQSAQLLILTRSMMKRRTKGDTAGRDS